MVAICANCKYRQIEYGPEHGSDFMCYHPSGVKTNYVTGHNSYPTCHSINRYGKCLLFEQIQPKIKSKNIFQKLFKSG